MRGDPLAANSAQDKRNVLGAVVLDEEPVH